MIDESKTCYICFVALSLIYFIYSSKFFNLRSIASNSKGVLMKLPAANAKKGCTNESLNMDSHAITEKLLGMYWKRRYIKVYDEQKHVGAKLN